VRDVAWEGDELVVTVTPTYSGCPATAVIARDIETALNRRGIERVRTRTRLSPAWTTDWISPKGRKMLRRYGIVPPERRRCAGTLKLDCPRCGSPDTQEVSRFGSTPCKAAWRCNQCLEPFDYFKSF